MTIIGVIGGVLGEPGVSILLFFFMLLYVHMRSKID